MFRKGGRAPNPMHQEDVFMHYRDPSSRSERGGESKAPADRATPSVHQPSSHPPALQRKPLATRQASLQERPANDGKTSERREGKRTGSPRDAHTEPHDPDRPHPAGTPALQSSACATAQAFDHKTGVPAGKASRRQEDQRITGRPADHRRTGTPGVRQRHLPRDTHGRHSRPREGHSSFDYFIALSIN